MRLVYQVLVLLLLAATLPANAQAIVVEDMSGKKLVDDDSWYFRAGDSTGWASPRYDAHHWTKISPNVILNENPALWKTGRGWFRQTFRFRRLWNKESVIDIRQFGQSEVYLDGQRMATLRPAGYDSGGSQQLIALLPLRITDTNRHTLAVRYAFRRDPLFGAVIQTKAFRLDFTPGNQAVVNLVEKQRTSAGITYLLVGVFGLLSVLHFLFYRANPAQRVHRVLAVTVMAFALIFVLDEANNSSGTLTADSVYSALSRIGISVAFALLLLSLYTYLGRRTGWIFWGCMLMLAAYALYSVFIGSVPDTLAWIPFLLVLAEYIRVSWLSKRRNPDPDARLPWNSLKVTLYALIAVAIIGTVGGIVTNVFKFDYDTGWITVPMVLLGLTGLFSVPLGLSLSLVRDYARTYLSLRQKLNEVEHLSAQTLRQEQEKQQLLTHQNEMLEQQVADRTVELEQSLVNLHETQAQLIQREKLASLGELMAGIAHEIQNPLNFVTNFSDVSTELASELQEEQQKPDRDTGLESELLGDLKQNLQKITHHGHRASSIVRGMLEHSRKSTGTKELIDVNALCDEYFRLAYHGFRGAGNSARKKDGSADLFACELVTDYDPAVGKLMLVSQDISRVLLNLSNNAFYAVLQRQKTDEPGYQPTVRIATKKLADHVEIRIANTGAGIPDALKQKIFQPFFTTKPTGEGTGLGLSLSYDIITKGHGGQMVVESEAGAGTEFTIILPIR